MYRTPAFTGLGSIARGNVKQNSNPILSILCPVQNGEHSTEFRVCFLPRTYEVKPQEVIKIQTISFILLSSWQCRRSSCPPPRNIQLTKWSHHHQIPAMSANCVRTRSTATHPHKPDWHVARHIKLNQIKSNKESRFSSLQAASNKSLRWTKSRDSMLHLKLLRQRTYTVTIKWYIMCCKYDCYFVV